MLGVYIGIASVSVIIVSFFVDGLPKQFVDANTSIADSSDGEVRNNEQVNVMY